MKWFLRTFRYVRELEDRLERTEMTLESMNRFIDQLEKLKALHEEQITELQKENRELRHHLNGGPL